MPRKKKDPAPPTPEKIEEAPVPEPVPEAAEPAPKAKRKKIAKTLADIHEDDRLEAIRNLNDSEEVIHLATQMKADWSYDLFSRNPGPALTDDGVFQGTDLDLACFLSALADRGAVINLPEYKARRASRSRKNERVVSDSNRHGQVKSLISNKTAFSFSLQILDMNVVTTLPDGSEKVGAPRNFMLQDIDGKWHDGWNRIEFSPSAKENEFLNDKKLWTGHTVVFKNFIHPNRWVSFYGQHYFLLKAMIARLELEAKHLRSEIKALKEAGLKLPVTGKPSSDEAEVEYESEAEKKKIEIDAFEAEVDFGEFFGSLPKVKGTVGGLKEADDSLKYIQFNLLPTLRFFARTVEFSFHKQLTERGTQPFPSWIKNAKWEQNFVPTGKRTKWNRLVLGQSAPGEFGHAIRYRVFRKIENVAV